MDGNHSNQKGFPLDSSVRALPEILDRTPGWQAGNILDVRPRPDFAAGHLAGAVSHPLPAITGADDREGRLVADLPSIFLPPRHEALLVVCGPDAPAAAVARHLEGRGRPEVTVLALGAADIAALPPAYRAVGPACGHLWSAPPWLVRHASLLPPPAAGPVLDLACGSARAVVWLAARGYRVTGLDWQPEALALGRQLAASRGASCRLEAADLRDPAQVPAGPWAVVLNFRFLQRELLERIPSLLQPGGVAVIRTFRDAPGYTGHPRPRHRLRRSELLGCFPARGFDILAHEEGHDPDGRPAAGIVARKKSDRRST